MRALLVVAVLASSVPSLAQQDVALQRLASEESAPQRLPFVEGPTPDGYTLRSKPQVGLLVTGSVVFAGAWLFGGLWSAVGLDNLAGFIPVIGPLLAVPVFFGRPGSEASGGLCIAASVLQFAGLVAIPLSFVFPKRWFERVSVGPTFGVAGLSVALAL